MSKNDIEHSGASVWPLAPASQGVAVARPLAALSAEPNPASDLNLAAILKICSEWRWLIVGAVALGASLAIVTTFLMTPLYGGTAMLELNPPTVEIMEGAGGQASAASDREFLATQYGLLKSRGLAERVAQELNLASNPEFAPPEGDRSARLKSATNVLMANLEVEPQTGSRLVRLSYSSASPEMAARIANSFADNFINSNLERRYESSSYARSFLERQIQRLKGELERSERQLVAYAQAQGIIKTSADTEAGNDASSLQGASLVALNSALAEAQTRRIAAEQAYRQSTANRTTTQVLDSTAPLRTQKASLEADYQEKLTQFKPDYPEMVSLRNKISALDRQIRAEAGNVAGGRSNTLLQEYQAAAAAERSIQARVNGLRADVLDLRGRNIQYNILRREVDTNRSLYDALLQRYKEIGVAGGVGQNLVSVVDRAEVPTGPYSPNLLLNLLIGLAAGLAFGVATALGLEILNDTVKTPDDVRDKLNLTSLGVIPRKAGSGTIYEELEDQTSAVSEAYYSLRTSLQFTTDHGAPRTLLITSTRAAEGKSSTTLAMAQNFARLGKNVLLIDSDLRKPAFVVANRREVGLSKLLTEESSLGEHVLATKTENLWLLPCGPLPPNPAELLASARLKAVLVEAASKFDMVIIDGPPVLGLADAPLLGAVCEGTLIVVESAKTRTRAVRESVNRLRVSGTNIIGAVLTKYRHQSHGYGYGYGYEPYKYGGVGNRQREIRLIAPVEA